MQEIFFSQDCQKNGVQAPPQMTGYQLRCSTGHSPQSWLQHSQEVIMPQAQGCWHPSQDPVLPRQRVQRKNQWSWNMCVTFSTTHHDLWVFHIIPPNLLQSNNILYCKNWPKWDVADPEQSLINIHKYFESLCGTNKALCSYMLQKDIICLMHRFQVIGYWGTPPPIRR